VQYRSIIQIAYLVTDVRAAAEAFSRRTGAGPFFVRRHKPLRSATHRGHPAAFDHSSAYGQWGHLQVELVQVHEVEPDTLAAAVSDAERLHHVTWFVGSLDEEQDRLERLGWPALLTAETASGFRFAFHDARGDLGHLVEVYEPDEGVVALYERVAAAAAGWQGDACVREL